MSYDIRLVDPVSRDPLQLDAPHHMRGGTYAIEGTTEAHLNVTYNYSDHFFRVFAIAGGGLRGIRTIYGMTGAESIPVLDAAIAELDDDINNNYWNPTEGNAKRALMQLRALATLRPDGVWSGD